MTQVSSRTNMMSQNKTVALIILDGWGLAPEGSGNAVKLAKTPNFDRYWSIYPHTELEASGQAVGLPPNEDGNSETGHLNLGSGKIVYQDLPRINMAVAEGTFFKNPAFKKAIDHVKKNNSKLHLMGLVSDSGVHSKITHLFALLKLAKTEGLNQVYIHPFTDGRDSPPTSSLVFLKNIIEKTEEIGVGKIATIIGRYYAMDRSHHWERTEKAYNLLVLGKGKKYKSVEKAISESYEDGKTDEFIEPIVLVDQNDKPKALIENNDAVIFYNFRIDRPRQLTKAFVLDHFEKLKIKKLGFDPYAERYGVQQFKAPEGTTTFERKKVLKNLEFVTMTRYEENLPVKIAFPPVLIEMPLARVLSEKGIRQLHIAETEKFPHVTYFFNGGREKKFPGEDQIRIPSPDVATYDLKPEMSINEVTKELIKRINRNTYRFILVNFANPDMVAHTGDLDAGIKACEVTDKCLGKVVKSVTKRGGMAVICADHGNAEEMINLQTGEVDTEHSNNPVPLIIIERQYNIGKKVLPKGILADVAPTILHLLGIPKPSSMTGRDLLKIT